MVLFHLFLKLNLNFEVAHCNFQLRGEDSNLDQKLVEDSCLANQINCHIKKFKITNKSQQSVQMQARHLRYAWFNELLQIQKLDHLVTAHHANDQVETFFINFIRGSGLEGLTGINNHQILRPLLPFSKNEIINFAKENKIAYREDLSNNDNKYVRNKIRLEVLPVLEELNPSFIQTANQNMDWINKHLLFFKEQSEKIFNEIVVQNNDHWHIDIQALTQIQSYELLLFDWLKPYGFEAWHDINQLIYAQTGKKVLSSTHQLLKNRGELILSKIKNQRQDEYIFNSLEDLIFEKGKILVEEIQSLTFFEHPTSNIQLHLIYIDKNSLKFPLKIRKYQKGDYFYPFGMSGKKKLSKFFKDEKFSQIQKDETWLLCADDQIIWVINHRMDNRFKIKPETTHILKLTYHEN